MGALLTLAPPFAVFCIPYVSILRIRQVMTKLFIEPEQGELAPLKFLPGALGAPSNTAVFRG